MINNIRVYLSDFFGEIKKIKSKNVSMNVFIYYIVKVTLTTGD